MTRWRSRVGTWPPPHRTTPPPREHLSSQCKFSCVLFLRRPINRGHRLHGTNKASPPPFLCVIGAQCVLRIIHFTVKIALLELPLDFA